MKKITIFLFALFVGAFAMQVNAAPGKAPMRSAIFNSLPSGFQQLGNTSIYYDVSEREAAGMGTQTGYCILGKIGNQYYSSTYEPNHNYYYYVDYGEGAGFIAAFQVNNGTATYLNAANGTTANGVTMTARIEAQGEVAARITYTLTNNNNQAVSVNAGVYGDIMIGDNDQAPLERLTTTTTEYTYGIKMKYSNNENSPLLCALFGEGVTGVTAADDYWFGFFSSNWHANEICGEYSSYIYPTNTNWGQSYSQCYLVENGDYDSGLGFCWKNREIPAHESIELSYLISVGEIDFEEPIIPDPEEPGDDIFTYNIEDFNCNDWNNYSAPHPIHVWGQYEHPYGQNGYLEYQVDDENTWHTMGELISGDEDGYDFEFNITYNPNRATDHVIAVRFNDGLDNITPLDGLSLTDIRSIPVTITCQDEPVYNGQSHLFNVNIDRETITIGQNGEYVNPDTYHYYLYGAYADRTIGVKDTPFSIDKAQPIVEVVIPDDCPYTGNPYSATVTVIQGGDATVTYLNLGTGQPTVGDPFEIGVYSVIVTVAENEFYYGSTDGYGELVIYSHDSTALSEINAATQDKGAWYTIDGRRVAAPTQPGLYIHNGKKYVVK